MSSSHYNDDDFIEDHPTNPPKDSQNDLAYPFDHGDKHGHEISWYKSQWIGE